MGNGPVARAYTANRGVAFQRRAITWRLLFLSLFFLPTARLRADERLAALSEKVQPSVVNLMTEAAPGS